MKGKQMKRSKLLLMIVGIAVLALTGTAFAANQVFLKTTVPNIPKTPCEQAGSITQEFPKDSILHENDVIQFTLSNNVTLCKDINFFLRLTQSQIDAAGMADLDAGTAGWQIPTSNDANFPIVVTIPGTGALDADWLTVDGTSLANYGTIFELGFLVKGNAGSQIFTMTLSRRALDDGDTTYCETVGNDPDYGTVIEGQVYNVPTANANMTVNYSVGPDGDANDRWTIKLFDEKYSGMKYGTTGAQGGADAFFLEDRAASSCTGSIKDYVDLTEPEDNVLCIDILTKNYAYEYVYATPDSLPFDYQYKITFSGDYTVAHILAEEAFVVTKVCKDVCGQLNIGTTVDQFGNPTSTVSSFDPGNYINNYMTANSATTRWTGNTLNCTSTSTGILVYSTGGDLPIGEEYTLTLTVLVNGVENASAAYWASGVAPASIYWANYGDSHLCGASTNNLNAVTFPAGGSWAYVRNASDTADITTQVKSTFQVTYGTDDAILIDVGTINIGASHLVAGQDIEVNVELSKFPCAAVIDEPICVAQVVERCTTGTSTGAYALTFPYTTGVADANFWVGLAIDNLSGTDGTATITFYDQNGDTGTTTVDIAAHNQWVNVISTLASQITGDIDTSLPGYIIVTSDFMMDGLLFVGDMSTTYLHGYLPRQ